MLIDDLKNRFPDIDPDTIDKYFPVYEESYKAYYNADYGVNSVDDEIILNLLAHLITVSSSHSDGSEIRLVGGESDASLSVSYVSAPYNNSDMFFSSSIYGQTYLMLIKRNMGMYFV